jgi:restriction modification system DNA specificity domain protein
MSRLAELIEELCPDGVEYRLLGELGSFFGGLSGKTKSDFVEIEDARPFVTYREVYSLIEIDRCPQGRVLVLPHEKQLSLCRGDVLFTGSSENADEVGLTAVVTTDFSEPVYLNSFSICLRWHDDTFDSGYAKYLFTSSEVRRQIRHCASGVTRFNLSKKRLEGVSIPVPPLEVQREIARILDQFTTLEAELEAELTIRRRQHSFYRSELLARESLQKRVGVLEYKTLGDLFETRNGYTPSKRDHTAWDRDDVPWFRMEDIRENGGILESALISISNSAVKAGRVFPANSILVATSATIGAHALVTVEHLSNQRFTSLQPKEIACGLFDPYFLYYYCFLLDEYCLNHANVSSFASVDMRAFRAFEFPILPLDVQCEIASILDQFTGLETELEAEIEARRAQYAYYRDRLLSFPEKRVSDREAS